MRTIYNSVTELISNTPLLKLTRVVPEDAANVYVMLVFENSAGSIKDRIALAMAAAAKGYHITIVMPETMSVERRKLMKGYGAELILTPGSEGMKGSIAKAEELVKEKGYYMPMQFDNPENPNIHESTTGPEIIAAMNGIGKSVDAFVVGVGTGGTLSGIGRALKKEDPNTKVYALEPSEAPLLKEGKTGKHVFKVLLQALFQRTWTRTFTMALLKFQLMKQWTPLVKLLRTKASYLVSLLAPTLMVLLN